MIWHRPEICAVLSYMTAQEDTGQLCLGEASDFMQKEFK